MLKRIQSTLTLGFVLLAIFAASAHAQSRYDLWTLMAGQLPQNPAHTLPRETIRGSEQEENRKAAPPSPAPQVIRKGCFCTQHYDPVVCDGVVYSNACFANCAGAKNCSPGGPR